MRACWRSSQPGSGTHMGRRGQTGLNVLQEPCVDLISETAVYTAGETRHLGLEGWDCEAVCLGVEGGLHCSDLRLFPGFHVSRFQPSREGSSAE